MVPVRALLIALVLVAPGGQALAVEEPEYELLRSFDAFELRRYAPQLVAETRVEGSFDESGGEAFRILAGFIFGDNRAREKVAMTAPVTQEPASEKIAMTAPVTQEPADGAEGETGAWVYRFVMPASYTMETLPVPNDPRVTIRELPPRVVAARRFSGTWREKRFLEHQDALLAAVASEGLETRGLPQWARYNSPFSIWFLRRNEILVEIEPESAGSASR